MRQQQETENIGIYRQLVQNFRSSESDAVFPNRGNDHAEIVLSNIFQAATSNINMLTGSMNENVLSDEFKDSLTSFLEKEGTSMRVIFTDGCNQNIETLLSPFVESGKVQYKVSRTPILFGEEGNQKAMHFTTADGKMLRLETDVTQYSAKCSFNRPTEVNTLNNVFDTIFEDIQ